MPKSEENTAGTPPNSHIKANGLMVNGEGKEVQANATLRMGYTRIEPIPGRPLAFVASCNVIQRQRTEWGE